GARLLPSRDQHHDSEHEEHGDRPRVDDDLGGGEELRAKDQVETGHAREVHHQEEGGVDGIPVDEHAERRAHHEHGQEREGEQAHAGLMPGGMGTGDVGTPSARAGSRARSVSFVYTMPSRLYDANSRMPVSIRMASSGHASTQ